MTSLRTAAAFPSDHRLHAGRPIKFLNDFARDTVRDADVILSLDWVDLGGLLAHAWKSDPVKATVIQASVDVQVHNGFGMEHLALPAVDLNLLADADSATTALLTELRAELRAIRPARPRAANAARASSYAGATPTQPSAEASGCVVAGAINAIAATGHLPHTPESRLARGHDALQPPA
jgi:thiamine pyrophosphate-dependent acetolactate synthase large subunit-like protein